MKLSWTWKQPVAPAGTFSQRPTAHAGHLGTLLGLCGLLVLGLASAVAPWALAFLFASVLLIGGTAWIAAYATAGAPPWVRLCTAVAMAQLVLNYGFATVVLPVGSLPITISELVLAIALVACLYHTLISEHRVQLPALLWVVLLWAVLNLAWHLPGGLHSHGLAAARDALPTAEVLFALPGFVAVSLLLRQADKGAQHVRRCTAVLCIAVAIYGLGYSVKDLLLTYSPKLPSVQQNVALLGSFHSWPMVGLLGMLAFALWRWQSREPLTLSGWMAGVLIFVSGAYTFFAVQSRAAYLIAAFFLLLMLALGGQGKRVLVILCTIIVASLALLLMETLGLELKGRVSNLSASQIFEHLFTLSGNSRTTEFQGAAAGIGQRQVWIDQSLALWQQNPSTMVFGIGFGDVLTNHTVVGSQGQTILVREPHNSYISILTRSGMVGLMVNLALHGTILIRCMMTYRRTYKIERPVAALVLAVLFIHVYCLLTALGQPVLESPNIAVPLHFILGAAYALTLNGIGSPWQSQVSRGRLAPA